MQQSNKSKGLAGEIKQSKSHKNICNQYFEVWKARIEMQMESVSERFATLFTARRAFS